MQNIEKYSRMPFPTSAMKRAPTHALTVSCAHLVLGGVGHGHFVSLLCRSDNAKVHTNRSVFGNILCELAAEALVFRLHSTFDLPPQAAPQNTLVMFSGASSSFNSTIRLFPQLSGLTQLMSSHPLHTKTNTQKNKRTKRTRGSHRASWGPRSIFDLSPLCRCIFLAFCRNALRTPAKFT